MIFIQELLEVLFSEGEVLEALRLARNVQGTDSISARKFLQSAQNTGDALVFYAVYDFFVQRNIKLTGSSAFSKSEYIFEIYIEFFLIALKDQPKMLFYII